MFCFALFFILLCFAVCFLFCVTLLFCVVLSFFFVLLFALFLCRAKMRNPCDCVLFWYLITVTQHKFYLLGTGQVPLWLNKFINCCFWLERLRLSFLSIHVQWCEDGLIAFSGFIRSCATRCVLISKSPSFLEHLPFKDPDTPGPDKTRCHCESLMRFWLKNIESYFEILLLNVKIIGRDHLNSVLAEGGVTDNVCLIIFRLRPLFPKRVFKMQATVLYFNVEVCKNITCPVFKHALILLHVF